MYLQDFVNQLGTRLEIDRSTKQQPQDQPLPQKLVAPTEYIALRPGHNAHLIAEKAAKFMKILSAVTIKLRKTTPMSSCS